MAVSGVPAAGKAGLGDGGGDDVDGEWGTYGLSRLHLYTRRQQLRSA